MRLKDDNGLWELDMEEIAGIIKNHFQSLYRAPQIREFDDILSLIDPVITPENNIVLTRAISREEVRNAVFQMGPLKAPGSDGFPGLFYQTYWDIVGDDVFEAVQSFFSEAAILKEINHANVTLIPKVKTPEVMS